MDEFGLEQAVDGLRECIVVTVTDAADGRLNPGLGEAFGVSVLVKQDRSWTPNLA